jgi:hypothetical protein
MAAGSTRPVLWASAAAAGYRTLDGDRRTTRQMQDRMREVEPIWMDGPGTSENVKYRAVGIFHKGRTSSRVNHFRIPFGFFGHPAKCLRMARARSCAPQPQPHGMVI